MMEHEIKKHMALNELAEQGGTVILGGSADRDIPLCELKQAFFPDSRLYNRSISALSVDDAVQVYETCVAPLSPECVLLHLGAADADAFRQDPAHFDSQYRALIARIRATDRKCGIVVVSLTNPEDDATVAEINRHLKALAESEQCEFGDIASGRVWNPKQTKDVLSFVHAMGFDRPFQRRCQLYDLIRVLFCSVPSAVG